MFVPNNSGYLSYRSGSNKFGEPTYDAPVKVPCAVIQIKDDIKKTAIRTDSSASRANADELVAVANILFPTSVRIANGDKFQIAGFDLRVIMVEPRFSTAGVLDHNECAFEAWAD